MDRKFNKTPLEAEYHRSDDGFELDSLLHPAQAFEHPSHVVNDPDLTLNEKRAILASWASDACARARSCPTCLRICRAHSLVSSLLNAPAPRRGRCWGSGSLTCCIRNTTLMLPP